MTGWVAVAVFTGLAVIVLVGVNVRIWRRMRAATEAGRARQHDDG